jgi:hypothetical protein
LRVARIVRTGPIGRLARAGLAAAYAATLLSIVDWRGSARFRNPHILSEPSAWFLHLLMFTTFLILVGALATTLAGPTAKRRFQVGAFAASLTAVAVAALIGLGTQGAAWGFPLADLVWWFDVLMLSEGLVATLLAIILGTPGCEIGVWPDLLARARGGDSETHVGLACIVGLHLLDTWEARARVSSNKSLG